MSEQPTTTQSDVVYHWIITVRLHDGTHAQLSNLVAVTASATRAEIFAYAQKKIYEQLGTDNAAVVFFDAAPNNLLGGAR